MVVTARLMITYHYIDVAQSSPHRHNSLSLPFTFRHHSQHFRLKKSHLCCARRHFSTLLSHGIESLAISLATMCAIEPSSNNPFSYFFLIFGCWQSLDRWTIETVDACDLISNKQWFQDYIENYARFGHFVLLGFRLTSNSDNSSLNVSHRRAVSSSRGWKVRRQELVATISLMSY